MRRGVNTPLTFSQAGQTFRVMKLSLWRKDMQTSSKENIIGIKTLHEVCSFEVSHNKEKFNSQRTET
jgi:hypothetical protein